MTAISMTLDRPVGFSRPPRIGRFLRRVAAARRLAHYPSRRRAAIAHAQHWAAMHIAQQH